MKVIQYNEEDRLLFLEAVRTSKSFYEVIRKLGRNTSSASYKQLRRRIDFYKIDYSHFLSKSEIIKDLHRQGKLIGLQDSELFNQNSTVSRGAVKRRFKELKPYKCCMCNQGEYWMNKKISLILDHINGVRDDNRLGNLRFLCPNCNATWETHCVGSSALKK